MCVEVLWLVVSVMSSEERMRRGIFVVLALFCFMWVPLCAFADNCKNLEKDKFWAEGFKKVNDLITDKKWDEALDEAHKLYAYCDRSPMINFYLGHIYKELGNEKNVLNYLRKATDYTEEFAIKGPLLERIWYERYEAEHPEARPEKIAEMKEALETERQKVAAAGDAQKQSEFDTTLSLQKVRSNYAAGLWTGVGLGAAGLVLGGVGVGMYFSNRDPAMDWDSEKARASVKEGYYIGVGLIGAGIGLTVAGAIVAGVMGHHYAQLTAEEKTVSLSISPTSVSFSMQF